MNNPFKRVTDELFEFGQSTKKAFVRDVVKGIPKTAVGQLVGGEQNGNDTSNQSSESTDDTLVNEQVVTKPKKAASDKTDPTTGKLPPSKRVLSDLKNAAAQLQMQKLQQVREELAKQRNKVSEEEGKKVSESGPEVKVSDKKLDDGAVARTLRASSQTGEFKGSTGAG